MPGWSTEQVLRGFTARTGHPGDARPAPGHYGAFGRSPEYTVGVEEEFMLVDAESMALVPAAPALLGVTADPANIKPEIRQCMLEISSQACRTTYELYDDLAALRRRVVAAASEVGCRVAGGGIHAFSSAQDQAVTDTDRYRHVITESGFPARWSLVLGTHVHVAVASADKALDVTEAVLADLPTLVALASSSPVWNGVDTGLASTRLALWASVPRSGLPPRFSSFAEYRSCLDVLHGSGAVPDASHIWWDVRSQERLGTLEVRLFDGQPVLRDTVALAGLVQSLVRHHGRRWDAGERAAPNRFLVAENRW
ncbi:MAG TPA: YbdK family carboxylate-amine ligase, partial [Candidatus Angelobacter sp.]|nr:YbdK family carboxylate-amine ligase [Candidatus Angelobacter sp.]